MDKMKSENFARRPIRLYPTEQLSSIDIENDRDHSEDEEIDTDESEGQNLYPDLKFGKDLEIKHLEKRRECRLPKKHNKSLLVRVSYTFINNPIFNYIKIYPKPAAEPVNKIFANRAIFWSLLVIAFGIMTFYYFFSEQKQLSYDQVVSDLLIQYNQMQSIWSKKILTSALKHVVNSTVEPSTPAIVTILASPGATSLAKSFCVELTKALVPNFIMIDENVYGQGSGDDIKQNIENAIESSIIKTSLNAVVVDQVENIPLPATMIFHNYCDETYARYKRVIYMFILTLNQDLSPDAGPYELDKAAMKHYAESWKPVHSDVFLSLITRLTVNVINFRLKH